MIEPWFSADAAPFFSLLSLLALLSLLQPLATRGQRRTLVLGCYVGATAAAALLLVAGAVAAMVGQPDHVSGTLMFAGGLTFVLMGWYVWHIVTLYRQAELHRSVANDL